jgi:hypothetical protein
MHSALLFLDHKKYFNNVCYEDEEVRMNYYECCLLANIVALLGYSIARERWKMKMKMQMQKDDRDKRQTMNDEWRTILKLDNHLGPISQQTNIETTQNKCNTK